MKYFGIFLIILQLLSIIGSFQSGSYKYFTNITNLYGFLYDLLFFIGAHLPGIIGIILISQKSTKTNNRALNILPHEETEHPIDQDFTPNSPISEAPTKLHIVSRHQHNTTPDNVVTPKKQTKISSWKAKRAIIIAPYIVLSILVIGLSVTLFFSMKNNYGKIADLEIQNADLQTALANARSSRDAYQSDATDLRKQLQNTYAVLSKQQQLTAQYQADAEQWKQKLLAYDAENITYSDSFNSVYDLLMAIKENPNEYNKKTVKLMGTAIKYDGGTFLIDRSDSEAITPKLSSAKILLLKGKKNEAKQLIEISVKDDLLYTVLETGDYIKIYGTIKISNGNIILDSCTYELVTSGR